MPFKDPEKAKEYAREYQRKNKEEIKKHNAEYRLLNLEKIKKSKAKYRLLNLEKIKKRDAEYRLLNLEKLKKGKAEWYQKYKEENSWLSSYRCAKTRCNNPNYKGYSRYGGRGIKFLMTMKDFEHLWFRDNADLMDRPSIDRIDSDGNYEEKNCRFIEFNENTRRAHKGKQRRYGNKKNGRKRF